MKKIYKICISLLLLTIMVFNGVNWNANAVEILQPNDVVPDAVVSLITTKTTLEQGDIQALTCRALPTGGATTFFTSNSSVVTVDQYGIITAHSVGTATITVRYLYNGYLCKDSVAFEVVPKSYILGIKNERVTIL